MNIYSPHMHQVSWVTLGLLKSSMLIFFMQLCSAHMNQIKLYYTHYIWGKKLSLTWFIWTEISMPKLGAYELGKVSYAPYRFNYELEEDLMC